MPLGVVGVAVGVALLPLLTRQLASGDRAGAADSQNRAIEYALLLTLPAAAALMVIAEPIVSVLFERGAFDSRATANTASALAAFAVGLPAYVLIKALTPGFFARQDTATPVKIAVCAMILNVAFAVVLMQFLAHVGIALATACSAWINAFSLGLVLHRRGEFRTDKRLRRNAGCAILAALAMAAALFGAAIGLAPWLAGAAVERVSALGALVGVGLIVYAAVATLLGALRLSELRALFRRQSPDA